MLSPRDVLRIGTVAVGSTATPATRGHRGEVTDGPGVLADVTAIIKTHSPRATERRSTHSLGLRSGETKRVLVHC